MKKDAAAENGISRRNKYRIDAERGEHEQLYGADARAEAGDIDALTGKWTAGCASAQRHDTAQVKKQACCGATAARPFFVSLYSVLFCLRFVFVHRAVRCLKDIVKGSVLLR